MLTVVRDRYGCVLAPHDVAGAGPRT